jgi:hypothetical protein
MSFFNRWGIGSTVVVELLILLALAFAVVRYVEWSSDAAMTEFMSAIESSAYGSDHSHEASTPIQSPKGRTACALGKGSRPLNASNSDAAP